VPQEYRPPEVAGRVYYEPSGHGFEPEVAERMRQNHMDRSKEQQQ
jgi:replication-associated recombination protein RarA